MAWQAKLNRAAIEDDNKILMEIVYYDTPDTATILHSRMFAFEPTTTNAQIQATIISEGQVARAALVRVTNFNAAFPVNTTVNIP